MYGIHCANFHRTQKCFINFGGGLPYRIVFQSVKKYINWGNILLCRQEAVGRVQQIATKRALASWQCIDIVRAVKNAGGSANGK